MSNQRSLRLFIALLVLAASGVLAQPIPGGLFEGVTNVDVVNVEVYVTRDGAPVDDLTVEDFRLYDDGEPVAIDFFSLVEAIGPEAVAGADGGGEILPPLESTKGRYVVYVDSLFLGPSRRARLFEDLEGAFEETLRPDDEVMVVTYDGSLDILLPFSTDRKKLRSALEQAAELTAVQMAVYQNDRHALELIQDFQRYEGSGQGDCLSVGELARNHSDRVEGRVMQSVETLTSFANSLAGVPGRKAILHVSDGIPLVAGGEAWEYAIELCDGSAGSQGIAEGRDAVAMDPIVTDRFNPRFARTETLAYDTTPVLERLAAYANVNNVAIYPVQASGLDTYSLPQGVRTTQKTAQFAYRNQQDSLVIMAEQTGGKAIFNTNDFATDLVGMVGDSRQYYLLGFQPTEARVGERHRLRVEVDQPRVRVRHRQSYQAKSLDERTIDSVLTALLHDHTENPLDVRLGFEDTARDGSSAGRPVASVQIPFEHLVLLPQGPARHGLVSVFVAVRDLVDGQMQPIKRVSVPLTVPVDGGEETFVYEVSLPLEFQGRYDVAIGVRDNFGGQSSFVREQLDLSGV